MPMLRLVVALALASAAAASAQPSSRDVSGIVVDARTGRPVAEATISIADARSPVQSDVRGRFRARLSLTSGAVVTAPGYVSVRLGAPSARPGAEVTRGGTLVVRLVPEPRLRAVSPASRSPWPLDDDGR